MVSHASMEAGKFMRQCERGRLKSGHVHHREWSLVRNRWSRCLPPLGCGVESCATYSVYIYSKIDRMNCFVHHIFLVYIL